MRAVCAVVLAVLVVLAVIAPAFGCASQQADAPRPNILLIYLDDVGYNDLSCYGAEAIETPRVDELAASGRRFTHGHAASATCTPSRFSLLTGRYPFRNERAEILPGDAPLLIEPGSLTIASHLASAGYTTAVIGKWHLGLGEGNVDWNGKVKPGPLEIGFDESYLLPSTNDRVPCVYLDGHRVENLDPADPITVSYEAKVGDWPTGTERPDLLRYGADPQHSGTIINGISRIGWQHGGTSALWKDEEMVDRFTDRAIDSMTRWSEGDEPWFLFFNLHNIHVPRLPNERFVGKSGLGLRGDTMLEADESIGRLIDSLDALGIRENTLVLLSSDNGPVMDDGYADGALEANGDHDGSGVYRGGKYTLWQGGTRVPFIASWPGTIEPGASGAMVTQVDLLATAAALAGAPLDAPAIGTIDSRDMTPALLTPEGPGRDTMVTQGVLGLSLYQGTMKYTAANQARRNFGRHWSTAKHDQPGNPLRSPPANMGAFLFDIAADPGEETNLAVDRPEQAEAMRSLLEAIVADPSAGG
ncbi:MAG: sulfatase-like hydrolase/transferase [Planctomycetota bacterium]